MSHWDILLRFIIAVIAGGVIGYERELNRHPAGLRTHILVCFGSAMVAMIECFLADQVLGYSSAHAGNVSVTLGRMSGQVVSGIGFLGAGTIIVTKRNIAGLTTAASLWAVSCIGLAIGMGFYGLAMIGAGFTLIVLTLVKRFVAGHFYKILDVCFRRRVETLEFINTCLTTHHIRVLDIDFRVDESPDGNVYTNSYTLDLPRRVDSASIITEIAEYVDVQNVRMRDP